MHKLMVTAHRASERLSAKLFAYPYVPHYTHFFPFMGQYIFLEKFCSQVVTKEYSYMHIK